MRNPKITKQWYTIYMKIQALVVSKGEYRFFVTIHNFVSINCCQDSLLILKINLSETVNKLWSVNEYFYLVILVVWLYSVIFYQIPLVIGVKIGRNFTWSIFSAKPISWQRSADFSHHTFHFRLEFYFLFFKLFLGSSHPILSLFHSFSKYSPFEFRSNSTFLASQKKF